MSDVATDEVDVAIVGTGFAGLGTAIQLGRQKRRRSFVLLEKAAGIGGAWRDNHYPGCACDVPSHLYSFSFAPNPRWSRAFAPQWEILDYLERCVDDYQLRPHLRLSTEVTDAEFDERCGRWRVHTTGGLVSARHLVLGMGALSRPAYPHLPGLERFRGKRFHSAEWDHDYPLAGKRVAVVGTGASAIQFVPQIAPKVAQLHLYQRTPPWIVPKPDRAVTPLEQRLFSRFPFSQRLYRYAIYWLMELRGVGFTVDPRVMRLAEKLGRQHIHAQIRDPDLRARVTPDYQAGCKRILIADDYYPTLERQNVELVTDAIAEVRDHSIVSADGREREVDAIIFGTGFRVTDLLTPMHIRGRGGVDLNDAWSRGAEAYLGTTIAGFPNLYMMTGPNTGLGHTSMVFMIEAQVRHVLDCMAEVERRGATHAEVRAFAQASFNASLAPRLENTVWSSGCKSWYLDAHGKNSVLWPGSTIEYWLRTRRLVASDYSFDG